jgi:hypothetical protein
VYTNVGLPLINIGFVGFDVHPVLDVNVNVTLPCETPVTIPLVVTVAIEGLLLLHVPPVDGDSVVFAPGQIDVGPDIVTVGLGPIVIGCEALDIHPEPVSVYVNVAVPCEIPVTIPELVIVAILALLLVHVPPVLGVNEVFPPIHIEFAPLILTLGLA